MHFYCAVLPPAPSLVSAAAGATEALHSDQRHQEQEQPVRLTSPPTPTCNRLPFTTLHYAKLRLDYPSTTLPQPFHYPSTTLPLRLRYVSLLFALSRLSPLPSHPSQPLCPTSALFSPSHHHLCNAYHLPIPTPFLSTCCTHFHQFFLSVPARVTLMCYLFLLHHVNPRSHLLASVLSSLGSQLSLTLLVSVFFSHLHRRD
ncbi:hypothetical protein DM02DRAFT_105441 [Periconia macrospinosa]|uniref:Uncharacterized protein n=1 Tax=Periconia macrospinosa TaxID=97972 RepID=A0A2V1DF61_9PLEO|nr:hypothetical protein DM02DRAFT_105441 [Periconia macrospinosa]